MPFVIKGSRRGGGVLAAAVAVTLLTAAPAMAGPSARKQLKQAAANPESCRPDHQLSNPFTAWKDRADYALAPGGDFETGASGWELQGEAAIVPDNQPYEIGADDGSAALALPDNSTAVSAPMCLDATYPHFRMFARNTGVEKAPLRVDVMFVNTRNQIVTVRSGDVKAKTGAWFPSSELKIDVPYDAKIAYGAAPVSFRFTTAGAAAAWRIDDVYVDPFARR